MKKLLFITLFFSLSSFILSQSNPSLYNRAMDAYYSGKFSQSIEIFNNLKLNYTLNDEINSSANYYKADALWKLGELQAAGVQFDYFANQFSNSSQRTNALYNLGLIYFQLGKFEKSRFYFNKIYNEKKETSFYSSSIYWIGEVYFREGNFNKAELFLKQAIDNPSNKYIDYSIYTLASLYIKKGEYKNAVKYFDQLLTYHSDSPLVSIAQVKIGTAYFKLKDYQSSILELNNPIITSLPSEDYVHSLYLLGNSNYRAKNFNKAEAIYKKIIKKYPDFSLIRQIKLSLAWSYFQQKKYSLAKSTFDSISDRGDNISEEAIFRSAESQKYSGDVITALGSYKLFIKNYPNSKFANEARYNIGTIYFTNGNNDLSEKYLNNKTLLSDVRISGKASILLGEIELNKNNYDAAFSKFNQILNYRNLTEEIKRQALFGKGVASFYQRKYNRSLKILLNLKNNNPQYENDKVNFIIAESYFAKDDFRKAISFYKMVNLKNKKVGEDANYGLSYSYFNIKDFENASNYFSAYIKKYPKSENIIDAKIRLADSYYGNKKFSLSSQIYNGLINEINKSKNADYILYQYSQALYKAGKIDKAIQEFYFLQKNYPNSVYADNSLYVIGWISFQKADYSDAINKYNRVLQIYPNTKLKPVVLYSIGDSYFNSAKYDSAIYSYQKLLVEFPQSKYVFDAVNGIQYSYAAQNKNEQAVTFLDRFVNGNINLKFADKLFYKIGELYYGSLDYNNAKKYYNLFVKKFPSSNLLPNAYYWIGKSEEELLNKENAIQNFTRVYQSYPSSQSAISSVIELGNLLNELKRYDDAITILASALDKYKENSRVPEIAFLLGTIKINKGDLSSAYDTFNDVIGNYSGTLFAEKSRLELGIIDLSAERYDNALYNFRLVAEKRNDDIGAQAQYNIGSILFEKNNLIDAISAFVRVKTVYSKYDEWLTKSYLRLGDIYLKLKDKRNARKMFRSVLKKHRRDKYGKEASKKLRKAR